MKTILFGFFLVLAILPVLPAMAQEPEAPLLKPAEAQYVCMVTDRLFDRPQIPVEVDGKTYYGCCMMCKARLTNDTAVRRATDPVSGAEVDKATAVIGANENRQVFYFENEENLQSYTGSVPHDHGDMAEDNMAMDNMMMDTMSDHDMSDHKAPAHEPEISEHDTEEMPEGDSSHH